MDLSRFTAKLYTIGVKGSSNGTNWFQFAPGALRFGVFWGRNAVKLYTFAGFPDRIAVIVFTIDPNKNRNVPNLYPFTIIWFRLAINRRGNTANRFRVTAFLYSFLANQSSGAARGLSYGGGGVVALPCCGVGLAELWVLPF